MPLKSGKGPKAHSQNVKEMLQKFKQTGKIGSSEPANMGKAMSQANAIAYDKGRQSKPKPKHAPPKKMPMSGPAISQFHAQPQGKSLPYPQKR